MSYHDLQNDLNSLLPGQSTAAGASRRTALKAALGVGYAASAGSIMAQTAVKTSSDGLTTGEINFEVAGFKVPAFFAAPAGKTAGGSRVVELQSLCPFRAQAELRLDARPMDQVSPGIDPLERGLLLHGALETLWGEFRDQDGLKAIDPATLRSRVHALVDRLSVPMLTGASAHRARLVAIEVDIATRKLCELLALERERPPFAVLERPEFVESYTASGLVLPRPNRA